MQKFMPILVVLTALLTATSAAGGRFVVKVPYGERKGAADYALSVGGSANAAGVTTMIAAWDPAMAGTGVFVTGAGTKTASLHNSGTKPVTLAVTGPSFENSVLTMSVTNNTCTNGKTLQPGESCAITAAYTFGGLNGSCWNDTSGYATWEQSVSIVEKPALPPIRTQFLGGYDPCPWVPANYVYGTGALQSGYTWNTATIPISAQVISSCSNCGTATWRTFTLNPTIAITRPSGTTTIPIPASSDPSACKAGTPHLTGCTVTLPVSPGEGYGTHAYTMSTTSGRSVSVYINNYLTPLPSSDISTAGPEQIVFPTTQVGTPVVSPSLASGNATILQVPNVYYGAFGGKYEIKQWTITGPHAGDFTFVPSTYPGCSAGQRPTHLTVANPYTTPGGYAQCDIQVRFTPQGPGPRTATLSVDLTHRGNTIVGATPWQIPLSGTGTY